MSNRVVDIVERCLRETFCMTSGCEQTALAILAALEKEGYKVLAREPTEEMVTALSDFLRGEESAEEAPAALHDAAPRYGEPSG